MCTLFRIWSTEECEGVEYTRCTEASAAASRHKGADYVSGLLRQVDIVDIIDNVHCLDR